MINIEEGVKRKRCAKTYGTTGGDDDLSVGANELNHDHKVPQRHVRRRGGHHQLHRDIVRLVTAQDLTHK